MHGPIGTHERYKEIKLGNKVLDYNPENKDEYILYEKVTVQS